MTSTSENVYLDRALEALTVPFEEDLPNTDALYALRKNVSDMRWAVSRDVQQEAFEAFDRIMEQARDAVTEDYARAQKFAKEENARWFPDFGLCHRLRNRLYAYHTLENRLSEVNYHVRQAMQPDHTPKVVELPTPKQGKTK